MEILAQGWPAAMAKGYKLDITHFFRLPAKYNYSASASPQPHIVFCLQPSEDGYNYYIQITAWTPMGHTLYHCSLHLEPNCIPCLQLVLHAWFLWNRWPLEVQSEWLGLLQLTSVDWPTHAMSFSIGHPDPPSSLLPKLIPHRLFQLWDWMLVASTLWE